MLPNRWKKTRLVISAISQSNTFATKALTMPIGIAKPTSRSMRESVRKSRNEAGPSFVFFKPVAIAGGDTGNNLRSEEGFASPWRAGQIKIHLTNAKKSRDTSLDPSPQSSPLGRGGRGAPGEGVQGPQSYLLDDFWAGFTGSHLGKGNIGHELYSLGSGGGKWSCRGCKTKV
jgi:hypothetical protein